MKKKDIKHIKIETPEKYEYHLVITDKNRRKILNRIKKIIRASKEYRDYIGFLKENVDMDHCAFFKNVTSDGNRKIRIEVHHHPLTLEDILTVIIAKQEDSGKPLNELMIAEEVMENHYDNLVGLIPLSKTLHEVVHNSNKIQIPLTMVYGNFRKFVEEYGEYIEKLDKIQDKIQEAIDVTKTLTKEDFDALNVEYTYLDVDGFVLPAKIEDEDSKSEEETDSVVA